MFKRKNEETVVEKILRKEDYIPPKILIDIKVLAKMKGYVDGCDKEIAWLAACKKENDRQYHIYDVFTCKQDVSGATAELHEGGLQELAERLMKEGRSGELSNIRVWGHSHVHMQVTPSGTDDDTFQEYYSNCDYFIRMILNKKGDMAIDIIEADRELVFYNVEWEVYYPENLSEIIEQQEFLKKQLSEVEDRIETEVKTMCDLAEKEGKEEVKKYTTNSKPKPKTTELKPRYSDWDDYMKYESDGYYNYMYGGYEEQKYCTCNICGTREIESLGDCDANGYYICNSCAEKLLKMRTVRICIGETNERIVQLYDLFGIDEIVELNLSDVSEIKRKYGKRSEFDNYTQNDWEQLRASMKDYVNFLNME